MAWQLPDTFMPDGSGDLLIGILMEFHPSCPSCPSKGAISSFVQSS